jgi:hypothetical protein
MGFCGFPPLRTAENHPSVLKQLERLHPIQHKQNRNFDFFVTTPINRSKREHIK